MRFRHVKFTKDVRIQNLIAMNIFALLYKRDTASEVLYSGMNSVVLGRKLTDRESRFDSSFYSAI